MVRNGSYAFWWRVDVLTIHVYNMNKYLRLPNRGGSLWRTLYYLLFAYDSSRITTYNHFLADDYRAFASYGSAI